MRPISITWPAAVTTAVALAQTLAGAGAMLINGTLLDQAYNPPVQTIANFGKGVERTVSLTSTGNISARTFTITGLDTNDNIVTTTLAGPNNNTVYTTALFNRVTSITVDGAVATATSAGSGTTGNTDLIVPDNMLGNSNIGLAVIITGTINVTVQYTADPPFSSTAPSTFFDHPTMASITASASDDGAAFPAHGWRMKVNSATTGSAIFRFDQAGGIS